MDRYARQRQLAPVGDGGQARIAQAAFVFDGSPTLSAEVEREYLTRAGAERLTARSGEPPVFAHLGAFTNQGARDFALGAWRALEQIRSILELSK